MALKYKQWVEDYLKRVENPYSKCVEATEEMAKAFPELRRVRGHAETLWGRREHWWLITPDNEVIDPTEAQFPGGVFEYEELKLGSLVRVGRCMNCGEYIWEPTKNVDEEPPHKSVCSDRCEEILQEEYNPKNHSRSR